MTHSLVIRNGSIVDGTGGAPYAGDVAIDGDTIVAVGTVEGTGEVEIDAGGAAITPGFIDLHTHLDAQIGWDPALSPSSLHGVTTALMGNCSVTFAPCKPDDRRFLAEMMETVEDIPRDAILDGLPWDWESYGEYLDSIERLAPALNICGLVGHAAIRYYVMGPRGIDENPNAEEIAQIAELAAQSIRDGAIGFSVNGMPGHRIPDGRAIPGTHAEADEMLAIAEAVGAAGGIIQVVPWYNSKQIEDDLDLLGQQAEKGDLRVLFSAVESKSFGFADPHHIIEDYRSRGAEIYGTTVPRCGGNLSNLKTVMIFPGWAELAALDVDERLAAIRDPEFRARLIEAAKAHPATMGMASRMRWLGDGDRPIYTRTPDDNLVAMAEKTGEHPVEMWLRMMDETDGEAVFHMPFFNMDFDEVEDLMNREWIVPGLGDAGAHVSMIMDAGWPSFLIAHWVRDTGKLSLAEAVRRMTSLPATVLALGDRGTLEVGKRADINVIDIDLVAERQPRIVRDFPHKKARLTQGSVGYLATVVNGQVVVRDGEHTGTRPGKVLRTNA